MKPVSIVGLCLASLVFASCATAPQSVNSVDAGANAAGKTPPPAKARPPSPQQIVKNAYAEATAGRKNIRYAESVAIYRKLRERGDLSTNRAVRVLITDEIVKACRVAGMHSIQLWDKELENEIPAETKLIIDDPGFSVKSQLPFVRYLAEWQASEKEDFAAAEKTVVDFLAAHTNATPYDVAEADLILSDLYKWQDRFDEAWAALGRSADVDARKATGRARALADDTGDWEKAREIWCKSNGGGEFAELASYWSQGGRSNQPCPKDYLERARKYVENEANPVQSRAELVIRFFCTDRGEEQRKLRASVKDADFAKVSSWIAGDALARAYQYADYALALELLDYFKDVKGIRWLTPAVRNRMAIICLAATGRKADAAKLADNCAAEEGVDALDKAKYIASSALLHGKDAVAAIAALKLESLVEAEVLKTAIRQSLIWGDSPAAEKCAAAYNGHFAVIPHRRQIVKWFDEPIQSVSDWRKVWNGLDKQYCDIKYRMTMEQLVTDVATGRSPVEASALDSDDARMELTTTCDRYGFHIFLRTGDPNTRAIENGFASGMSTEMYFAPGDGQPYACFGTTPAGGMQFAFQTMYDNIGFSRVDLMGEKSGRKTFRCETSFSDDDYVLHLFFGWENFYDKLPANGTDWKYDCITWTPKGAYTWAGSQGPHSYMALGDLRFELSDAQLTEIRRGLLYRTHKNWRKTGRLDIFAKWADAEIGDPEFSAAVLKPLETELAEAMAGVGPEMTDAEVNRIFEAALAKCRGIKHEIDALRKEWLKSRFCE